MQLSAENATASWRGVIEQLRRMTQSRTSMIYLKEMETAVPFLRKTTEV
ncbi:hypothetical protein [Noviherbaspirillum galbum]|nr:hypothetical protein [Noviherbaspirillum galbum]